MKLAVELFLLWCTHCIFSAQGSAPIYTTAPPNPSLVLEGNNITLEWTYNIGEASFRRMSFGNTKVIYIVEISASDSEPYIDSAYKGRLLVKATANYTSVTFLRMSRIDSETYSLTIITNRRRATTKVKISVEYLDQSKVTFLPQNASTREGDEVTFTCNATGNPEPTISWTRNGSPVNANDNSRISFSGDRKELTITNVSRTDSGEYRCVVNNSVGNDTSNVATLNVQYEPEITGLPRNVVKTEGDNVTLSCAADGNPAPTISWTRNESAINTTGNSRIRFSEDKKRLTIINVNRTDSGIYRCVANNIFGSDACNVGTLDVQYKPEIIGLPRNITNTEGDNVTLSCNADGNPAPTISWTRNGSPIYATGNNSRIGSSEDKTNLTITNVSRTDSGEYRCVANNSIGNTTRAATLNVQYQPEITVQPRAETKTEGDNVTVSCNADGNPVPTISWTRDGSPIDTSNNFRISFSEEKRKLSITNVKRTDSGGYRCMAKNRLGNDTSKVVNLDVQYQPEFTAHPQNVIKPEGSKVTLSCNATGNPVPTISWTRNGSPINTTRNNPRISFSEDKKQLTLTNVTRTDSGEYQCLANNSVGNATSDVVTLDVQYPPKIIEYLKNQTQTEGHNVSFNCEASGNPEPTTSWTRDGFPIVKRNNSRLSFSANKARLTITNVSRTDSGEYQCVVNNKFGNDDSVANLNIQYQPEITAQPRAETKTEGDNVTLSCNADGNPVPTISWTRNGSPVDKSNNSRIGFSKDNKQLTIRNINRTDQGKYRCVANNSVGNDTSTAAELNVQYKPEITVHPENQAKAEGDNVTLSCNADGNPVPTISWTTNGSPIETTGNSSISFSEGKKQLTITNVNRKDSGEYRCVASNEIGNDTSNVATLDVQFQPKITVHPKPKRPTEGDNVTLSCNASGNPEPTISWTRNESPINTSSNSGIRFSDDKKQLIITNVNRADSGEYRCVANNSLGPSDTSIAAELDVLYEPKITVHPENQTKTEGDNVALFCNATGNPVPTISWTKNGSPINIIDNLRIGFSGDRKEMTITNVNRADSGEYRCVANNSVGNDTSNVAALIVHYIPDMSIVGDAEQFAVVDKQMLLTCQYKALPPVSEVLWKKDGIVIATNANVNINDSRVTIPHYNESQVQLSINATTPQDAGNYTCLVTNDIGSSSDTTSIISQEQPSITVHPNGVTIREGQIMTLSCNATGNPVPTISWTRNGSPVNSSDHSRISFSDEKKQLTITNVSRTDRGEYRCVAINRVGNATSNVATVDVHFVPGVTIDGNPTQYVAKGNDILLACRYNASPPASEVQWKKDGNVITTNVSVEINDSRVTIPYYNESQVQLLIRNATTSWDAGNYTCNVTNDIGDSSDTTTIVIEEKPSITGHPQGDTVTEGENITLSCDATGSPLLIISWTRNGYPIDTNDNSSISFSEDKKQLTITNVNRTYSGEYQCVAKNRVGNDTSNAATVNVLYQSEITLHPKDRIAPEEGSVTLSCNATGNPNPAISWTRNGSLVDASNNSRISFSENEHQLTITNVNRTDSGEYQCVASNSVGNATSNVATLDVQYKPEITANPEKERRPVEGDNVTLSCNADGNPKPAISWTRNGSPVTTNDHSRISFSEDRKQLTITNVSRTDSGEYRCVANNSIGNATSDAATLDVQYQATITADPQNKSTTEGDNATFTCNATGNPKPTISWTSTGTPVNTNDNSRIIFSEDKRQLTIRNVSRTDRGEYRCVANNSLGNDTSNAGTLNVQYKPEITDHPSNTSKPERDNVILNCDAEGNPVPTISWTRNGSPINTTGNNSRISFSKDKKQLTIANVSRTDSGEYRCVASNKLGIDTSNVAILDVQFGSEISKDPHDLTAVEGQGVVFSCSVEGNPSPSVRWTKNGKGLNIAANPRLNVSQTNNNHSLLITDVHRSDVGQYSCVAYNSVDNSTSSDATLEVYFEPNFTSHPENVTVTKGETAILNCTVYGKPEPDVRWTKDGGELAADQRFNVSFTANTSSLTITNVVKTDQGLYRCVANNSVNNSTSDPGLLTVHFKPEVTIIGVQEQFVIVGKQILLTCQYDAFPLVSEVKWEKDGTLLAQNASTVINDSRVTIPHYNESQVQLSVTATTSQDAGNYVCLVTNDVGSSSNTTTIVIQVVPDPPINVTVDSKSSRVVNISWMAGSDGNSAIQNYTVEIRKDNQNFSDVVCQGSLSENSCVVPRSSTSASLQGLSPWTTYFISLFARNVVGTSRSSSVVTVTTDEEVPSAPTFNVTVLNSTAVNVSWQMLTKDEAKGAILGYYVLYKLKTENGPLVNRTVDGKDITSYLVMSLKKFTTYEFSMQALNSKGVSVQSPVVVRKTNEDVPSGPPQDVQVTVKSSQNISVSWGVVRPEDKNGIIKGYKVIYQALPNGNKTTKTIDRAGEPAELTTTLHNLNEFTNYSIAVLAFTVKGDGPPSVAKVVQTQQDKPAAPPKDVRGHNVSSTSILVTWDEVPAADQNGIILTYTITYESLTENHSGNVTVNYQDHQTNLTGLKEYVNYSITVFASTVKGDGPASDPIVVITDQDKPDGAPQNVTGHNSSSTSINVTWNEVPATDQNGIITGYTITYKSQTEDDSDNVTVGPNECERELINLKEYVNYNITVFASTVKGDGPASPVIVVRTDQDKPDGAPQNVTGHNSSSTSIKVMWNDVPVTDQNGIITGYTITYQSQTEDDSDNVTVGASKRVTELINLKEYVYYNITVFASTVKGDGPASPVIVVRTDQDSLCRSVRPNLHSSP